MPIEDTLILTREITQLNEQKRLLSSSIEQLKKENTEWLDLKDRLRKELADLGEKKKTILKDIESEKNAWTTLKNQEYQKLEDAKNDVAKIINRENYVRLEEEKLKQSQIAISKRDQETSIKESNLLNREADIEKKKLEATDYVEQCKKRGVVISQNLGKLKEFIINEVEKWQVK